MKEKKYKPSKSLIIFRVDLDEIFNTINTLFFYRYISGALKKNKKKIGLTITEDNSIFESVKKFEKQNYSFNFLYINLVAILEAYLQDRIAEELIINKEKINKLILEYDIHKKLTPQDIINGPITLADEILNGVVFHKLETVNILYKIVFGFDALSLMRGKKIWNVIKVRHKIVHRAGRIGHRKIFVRETGLLDAMTTISAWVENIDFYYRNKKERKHFPNFLSRHGKKINELFKSNIFKEGELIVNDEIFSNMPSFMKIKEDKHIHII
ncbi:MAG: hypothetical protein ISS80_03995 [Candidatus Cloacimonetes bacterium]|nr:hypothetical protein [Candidatus Cloacimonadota bacterium]